MIADERKTIDGAPALVVTVVGVDDVYRFANHLQRGQCEFADVGFRTEKYLRRKLSRKGWAGLMRYMHGDGGFTNTEENRG